VEILKTVLMTIGPITDITVSIPSKRAVGREGIKAFPGKAFVRAQLIGIVIPSRNILNKIVSYHAACDILTMK
jgi:hypothetical protein